MKVIEFLYQYINAELQMLFCKWKLYLDIESNIESLSYYNWETEIGVVSAELLTHRDSTMNKS